MNDMLADAGPRKAELVLTRALRAAARRGEAA